MSDRRQFAVRQIVWAKVSDYPWWPARIVKTLAQRSRNIYKVHFFGDPTYCYLQSQQLLDFENGLSSLQERNCVDQILKKPIQLAKAAYKKSKQQVCSMSSQLQYFPQILPNNVDTFEETKLESKLAIENIEKQYVEQKKQAVQSTQKSEILDVLNSSSIDNVVQHITGSYLEYLRTSKGYTNRKQVLNYQLKLKQLLLTKYNLLHIPKSQQICRDEELAKLQSRKKKIKKQKLRRKQKCKKNDIQRQSSKALFKIIRRNLAYSPPSASELVEKIINTLKQLSQNDNKKYRRYFLRIVKCVKYLQMQIQKYDCLPNQQIQQFILNNMATQHGFSTAISFSHEAIQEEFKKQDEEKSKVTQIQACTL